VRAAALGVRQFIAAFRGVPQLAEPNGPEGATVLPAQGNALRCGTNVKGCVVGPTDQRFAENVGNGWPVGPKVCVAVPSPGRCPGLGDREGLRPRPLRNVNID
jgi:hypothetical protein